MQRTVLTTECCPMLVATMASTEVCSRHGRLVDLTYVSFIRDTTEIEEYVYCGGLVGTTTQYDNKAI